jgi:predicted transcriptional regulator
MCGLTMQEKLSIVGSLIGRNKRITPETIYDAMVFINDSGKKITISGIANMLGCTTRTIHRNMNDSLKKEKTVLNNEYEKVQRNKLRPV